MRAAVCSSESRFTPFRVAKYLAPDTSKLQSAAPNESPYVRATYQTYPTWCFILVPPDKHVKLLASYMYSSIGSVHSVLISRIEKHAIIIMR